MAVAYSPLIFVRAALELPYSVNCVGTCLDAHLPFLWNAYLGDLDWIVGFDSPTFTTFTF